MKLQVAHITTYRYRQPVDLGVHTIMLSPRASRDIHLISNELTMSPEATVAWSEDVSGNAVASASFAGLSEMLTIRCVSEIELLAEAWPVFDIAFAASNYPFSYTANEASALGALMIPNYADPDARLKRWAREYVRGTVTDTLSLLKDINTGIGNLIRYQSREDEGTQSPTETLDRGWGACRDLSVLFVDAVRSLGFGARLVSGYLYDRDKTSTGTTNAGTTHAWAEVFVSGAGWIAFDPTNNRVGGLNLIPLAVGKGINEVMPVTGSFVGTQNALSEMQVGVSIEPQ